MFSIIIALSEMADGQKIKRIFTQNGYDVDAVYDSGSLVLELVRDLDEGIVICGYRVRDMYYREIKEGLPDTFQLLLIASPRKLENVGEEDVVCLGLPLMARDLINTVEMMTVKYRKEKKKKKEEQGIVKREGSKKEIVNKAKFLLMERNHMTEEDAYRYIQKISMDSGNNMAETAQMLLIMLNME